MTGLEEVDHEAVRVRQFSQSLAGEARKWFTSLPDNSILGYQAFEDAFKSQWAEKKYPRKCVSQFYSMNKGESGSIQEFSYRFMKVYHAIPSQFRPPLRSTQLQYDEAFYSEFTLWLSEIKSASMVDMMNYAIEVYITLTAAI